MEAGDLFFVLSYPHLMAHHAELIDTWQAHADGDLLELMGTHDSRHVAGFSDGDPAGDADPVPYLNRTDEAPNGIINGRERLAPGERLLWLRSTAKGKSCDIAMFELHDYCQVVSRTWDLKLNPSGYPLLLNIPTYDELPPGTVRTVRAAMRMARPQTWAPRRSDPSEEGSPVVDDPPPPEYWLTQLKPPPGRRRDRK
jgi:hypothetical protein